MPGFIAKQCAKRNCPFVVELDHFFCFAFLASCFENHFFSSGHCVSLVWFAFAFFLRPTFAFYEFNKKKHKKKRGKRFLNQFFFVANPKNANIITAIQWIKFVVVYFVERESSIGHLFEERQLFPKNSFFFF